MNNYPEIQELLEQRADLYARLKLLAYDGTPEIKEKAHRFCGGLTCLLNKVGVHEV